MGGRREAPRRDLGAKFLFFCRAHRRGKLCVDESNFVSGVFARCTGVCVCVCALLSSCMCNVIA